MATYNSIEDYLAARPDDTSPDVMQAVFVGPMGEIVQFIIPTEDWHSEIRQLMTSYVFVNDWKSIVHAIKTGR